MGSGCGCAECTAPVENGDTEMSAEEPWDQKEAEPNEEEPGGGDRGPVVKDVTEETAPEIMEEEEEAPVPKVPPTQPDAPKKEHINVVFIGHVGQCIQKEGSLFSQRFRASLLSKLEHFVLLILGYLTSSPQLCSRPYDQLTRTRGTMSEMLVLFYIIEVFNRNERWLYLGRLLHKTYLSKQQFSIFCRLLLNP